MTPEFKAKFRKPYGWSRRLPDYRCCCSWVAFDMMRHGKLQCPNPNGHGPSEAYCLGHAKKFSTPPIHKEPNE